MNAEQAELMARLFEVEKNQKETLSLLEEVVSFLTVLTESVVAGSMIAGTMEELRKLNEKIKEVIK